MRYTIIHFTLLYSIHCNRAKIATYEGVIVKYFHDYFRWVVSDALWVTVNLDGVKDERLIPRGTDGLPQVLCRLTVVEEHDSSKRIYIQTHPV